MSIFFGKFRGVVTDNRDPDGIGRIRARVPDATGERETGWALPALPYAGDSVGLFVLPPVGANVWIEFEGGDTELPIWTASGISRSPSTTTWAWCRAPRRC